ncbi:hypothetical protein AYI69_g2046 [Smittium culicis]|uniref:Uncharacterized protein n=1 Tax=Smittium culicis TaxID=133412 RepID=A0A1R1YNI3_9FUNG|nr:hypothetical protein AYI69_g2046 [Smittium culicis]
MGAVELTRDTARIQCLRQPPELLCLSRYFNQIALVAQHMLGLFAIALQCAEVRVHIIDQPFDTHICT